MPRIIDIIITKSQYKQMFAIIDRQPNFKYHKEGNLLLAEDDGFYSCYKYDRPTPGFYAFAGRKFNIDLDNGTVEHAYGQWWHAAHPKKNCYYCGSSTIESLKKCYVFTSSQIDKQIIDEWLSKHNHSNEYYKYEKLKTDAVHRVPTSVLVEAMVNHGW